MGPMPFQCKAPTSSSGTVVSSTVNFIELQIHTASQRHRNTEQRLSHCARVQCDIVSSRAASNDKRVSDTPTAFWYKPLPHYCASSTKNSFTCQGKVKRCVTGQQNRVSVGDTHGAGHWQTGVWSWALANRGLMSILTNPARESTRAWYGA
jgi:hypothetical protein